MTSDKPSNRWLSRSEYSHTWRHGKPSPRERSRESAMADWLGEDRRAGVFADLRPAPNTMADLVSEVLDSVKNPDLALLEKIQAAWPELVGADNARQSQPSRIFDGRLLVEVPATTWRFIFASQHQAGIRARVAEFTQNAITAVQFVPPGINPPASKNHPPRKGSS